MGTEPQSLGILPDPGRGAFLLELFTELATYAEPIGLVCRAMEHLRNHLGASSCVLAEIDEEGAEAIIVRQGAGADSQLDIVRVSLAQFAPLVDQARLGRPIRVYDTRSLAFAGHLYERWYGLDGAFSVVSVPLMRAGELIALMSVVQAAPRQWTGAEVDLVVRVADVMWPAFERARADRALKLSEARLRLAQSIASTGAWEWSPASGDCAFASDSAELFGLRPADARSLEDFLVHVDARDLDAVRAAIVGCASGGSMELEYRYLHPTRGERWLLTKAARVSYAGRPCVVGLSMDVTSRRRAEEALREVNERKDEFLAMLAHELRNPLAPIRNAAQILRMHTGDKPELDWARSVIERQSRHLTRLVDDLLDVSRIVRGQIVLERTVLDLREVVELALETSRPLVRARSHRLEVRLPDADIRLEGDLTRLAQVVSNLLVNAAKYTSDGGNIVLEARREGDLAVIRVRDSGSGIAPQLLPHVFDLFTQAERTPDRSQGGLGIGLTLVRRIVEMHGGHVAAHSAGPGEGSEFIVRLPLSRRAPETRQQPAPGAELAKGRGLRVLVVDDNVDSAQSISMLLCLEGHEVSSVNTAQDALESARSFTPEVVLLDIGLPGMDGYEVARRLRAEFAQPLKLVALTGYGQDADRQRARAAGFDFHLIKPVEPATLFELLRSFA